MLSKTRTTIITTIAAFSFGGAAIVPTVAQAKPPKKGRAVCVQNLPNGGKVEYASGTEITVVNSDGSKHKFRCNNGEWKPIPARISGEGTRPGPEGEAPQNKPESGSPRPTEGSKTTSTPPPAAQ
jgi:hypothetical protein